MKKTTIILVLLLVATGLWAQQPPRELCVGESGFATWLPPDNPNELIGYRLWLDNVEIGDITETEYHVTGDHLANQDHTFSVAAVYPGGLSEIVSYSFYLLFDTQFPPPTFFKGTFVEENTVELTWENYSFAFWEEVDSHGPNLITHPHAGYNNGWNVSALHDGLTAYGFNVNRDDGFMVMDKFDTPSGWSQGGIYGFRFFLYQDATPISTITGVYMAIYDDDPLNGGQLIYGDLETNIISSTFIKHIYRTSEDDFSDVNRPIACVGAGMWLEDILPGTYWFIATFTGSLKGGVYAVPRTIMGETTTGEARIYDSENGWQPLLDPGTGTQQGIAFNIKGPSTGGAIPIDYVNIYRDGELIAQGIDPDLEVYIDRDVPHGIHSYSIVNVYDDPNWWDCPNKSCPKTIDVRPCYPPKNFEVETEPLNEGLIVSHLTWDKEDDIPQREDIKTFFEIYRKDINNSHFNLVGVVAKDDSLESFEYHDTVSNGIHYYRVNDYNVYPTGSCQSPFAGRYGDCAGTQNDVTISGEAQWSNGTDGVMISWGDLVEGQFLYDNGVLMESVNNVGSNTQWGIMAPFDWQWFGSFIKSVSLYITTEGTYEVKIYEGYNSPTSLVQQTSAQLSGANQWHTITLDEPYKLNYYSVWIMVSWTGTTSISVPYAGDDGSTDNGRWVCYNNYWYKTDIDGSFMVRAQYDNRVNSDYLMQLDEPQYGFQHYNLYRSTNNVDYELIAQLPNPLLDCHVTYFDPVDDPMQDCYYYQLTLFYRNGENSYCETTPMLNAENPLIDWAEVCGTWKIDETCENENLALYPNPTTGLLTIAMDGFSHAEVYDLMGRKIKQSQRPIIDLQNVPQGIFVVKVFDRTGNSRIRKVIKN
ncbi:MAG: T9SS type A sorting domain-containing protein [Bacteroidales bacterium]|nr:T9SS type A sorting domain-containing protein [Bacteroidales bacterium]